MEDMARSRARQAKEEAKQVKLDDQEKARKKWKVNADKDERWWRRTLENAERAKLCL